MSDVTRILSQIESGDPAAADEIVDLKQLHPNLDIAFGVALSPRYRENRQIYVCYALTEGIADGSRVSRFTLTSLDPLRADPASEEAILVVPHPVFGNHNGGQLAFGPDGYLHIGTGDGGSGGDPMGNGQNPGALLGKLLRIDVESGTSPYVVPPDNPFFGVAGYRPEIWALGLRNPWRFSFDRSTGNLWIGDVGQNRYEEVDRHLLLQAVVARKREALAREIFEGLRKSHRVEITPEFRNLARSGEVPAEKGRRVTDR